MRKRLTYLILTLSILVAGPAMHAEIVCEEGHVAYIDGIWHCNPGAGYYSSTACLRCWDTITVNGGCTDNCSPENPTP